MSRTQKLDAATAAKHTAAPSTDGTTLGTTRDSTTDALRSEWAGIVAEFDRNAEAFNAYVADVRERIEHNHGWTGGTDGLRTFIREGHFIKGDGSRFKVGHGNTAVWCRELCHRHPDIAPHIVLRPSKFDRFYPELLNSEA